MLPIFKIGEAFNPNDINGTFIGVSPHENAQGAIVHTYKIKEGNILLTVLDGVLHEVIYQTPKIFLLSKKNKNKHLFNSYSPNSGWKETLDNGFGKTYRSNDGEMYALWSYTMDFNTFGTMQFHEVAW